MSRRESSRIMTPAALQEFAREWFLAGFRCSGERCHGETRLSSSAMFERMLTIEFERMWRDRGDHGGGT